MVDWRSEIGPSGPVAGAVQHFMLAVFVLVVATACNAGEEELATSTDEVTVRSRTATATVPVQATPTPEPTPRPPDPVMEMVTYRDERAGLALDYPADWFLYEPEVTPGSTYTVTFSPWEAGLEGMIENRASGDGIPADAQRIDLVVRPEAPASLDPAAAEQERALAAADPPATVVAREVWELSNVLPAQRWRLSAEGQDLHLLLTIIEERMILLRGQTNAAQFEEVARSLRPLARP